MSVHLIGGGRDEERGAAVLAPFMAEATDAAAPGIPTIALLLVLEPDDETSVDRFRSLLIAAGAPAVRVEAIVEGERFAASAVADAHGIFVGGGLTPAYHDAIMGIASEVRSAVARGVPYAGFSAGAAVAASEALVGGYLRNGVVVSPEDAAEELDEIEVRSGLGLLPGSVEVHAAQWGTLSRLVAAVSGGITDHGVAIDEHTAWIVRADGSHDVLGAGQTWAVERDAAGTRVSFLPAAPAASTP